VTVRTRASLADGREIFYYDRKPGADRTARDQRTDLAPTATSSQMRWNPMFRDYSVIAGHRQTRTYKPPADLCPLDPTTDSKLTEIPAADYEVAVFENRFPALSASPPDAVGTAPGELLAERPPAGRTEVVVYTADHDAAFADLSGERVELVLDALIDRTEQLSRVPGVDQVFCFENRGREIGVTQPHPHGQIYAYPFVPPVVAREIASARAYREERGGCLFCAVRASEE
jgi:UDPglucose--hexose-1-phosphate uridylyltransferase